MKQKKILVTGCCGFIGFNFIESLLKKNKNFKVYGIDNLDSYYSIKFKKKKISRIKKLYEFFIL